MRTDRAVREPLVRSHRASSRLEPSLTLDDLLTRWISARRPVPHTIYTTRLSVETFKVLIGDLLIKDICLADMFDFRDMLALIPSARTREEIATPLEENFRIWMADRNDRPKLAPTSIKHKVNAIQSLVGLAHAECWIEEDRVHGVPTCRIPQAPYRAFTKDELRAFFALPVFVHRCDELKELSCIPHSTVRWVCFIGLMTGARCSEIAQLQTDDIDAIDGVWTIRISELGRNGQPTEKHIKTLTSRRLVPVHPRLIDLGLLRYVQMQHAQGQIWLFPVLRPVGGGSRARQFRGRFLPIINKVSRDPRLVFHSFRHAFKDLCRQSGIEDSVNDQLTGQAPPTIGRAYGSGIDIATLSKVVQQLNFEFIDWEPILRTVSVLGDSVQQHCVASESEE